MCGRFTQAVSWEELARVYRIVDDAPAADMSMKGAPAAGDVHPGTDVALVRAADGGRAFARLHLGFRPAWKQVRTAPINARAETPFASGMRRDAALKRRCVVPVDGFYEPVGPKRPKRPQVNFPLPDAGVLSIAALWTAWPGDDRDPAQDTFALITTAANDTVAARRGTAPGGPVLMTLPPPTGSRTRPPGVETPPGTRSQTYMTGNDLAAMAGECRVSVKALRRPYHAFPDRDVPRRLPAREASRLNDAPEALSNAENRAFAPMIDYFLRTIDSLWELCDICAYRLKDIDIKALFFRRPRRGSRADRGPISPFRAVFAAAGGRRAQRMGRFGDHRRLIRFGIVASAQQNRRVRHRPPFAYESDGA